MAGDNDVVDRDAPLDDVIVQARTGSPEAYAEIWRRLSPAVGGFVRSRGARDPDDVTSEVFLAAFRALPSFVGGEREFRGLVFTIAQRRVVDEFRRRSRHPIEFPWSEEDDDRTVSSAEQTALEEHGTREAAALLQGLAPDQRDVLELRILGDLTIDQIAASLGKSPGAVKALQRRGLEALRRNLAAPGRTPFAPQIDPRL